jgi:hypothetical protein
MGPGPRRARAHLATTARLCIFAKHVARSDAGATCWRAAWRPHHGYTSPDSREALTPRRLRTATTHRTGRVTRVLAPAPPLVSQMRQDPRDHRRLVDQRNQPQPAATARARQHVDPERAPHQLRPVIIPSTTFCSPHRSSCTRSEARGQCGGSSLKVDCGGPARVRPVATFWKQKGGPDKARPTIRNAGLTRPAPHSRWPG